MHFQYIHKMHGYVHIFADITSRVIVRGLEYSRDRIVIDYLCSCCERCTHMLLKSQLVTAVVLGH